VREYGAYILALGFNLNLYKISEDLFLFDGNEFYESGFSPAINCAHVRHNFLLKNRDL
jgi:hypothetical protein